MREVSPEASLVTDLARLTGMTRRQVVRCSQLALISITAKQVEPSALRRLRRIRRLQRDLGLDLEATAIIVRLLEQIEELEARVGRASAVRVQPVDGEPRR